MFIKEVKKYTDNLLPISFYRFLEQIGLNPNRITFFALFFKIIVLYLFYHGQIFLGGIFIAGDYALDFIDGSLARRLGKQTPFGIFFDTVLDRIFRTAGWPIALAFGGAISFEIAVLIVAFNLLLIFSSNVVESNNLRHWQYMPNVLYVIPYGAILGHVELAANIEVVVGFALLVINTVSIIILNFRNNNKVGV